MSDYNMEFNGLDIGFDFNPLDPVFHGEVIFEPLALSSSDIFHGSSNSTNMFCQRQSNDLGFGFDSPALLPCEADLFGTQHAWNEKRIAASSLNSNGTSLNDEVIPSHAIPGNFSTSSFDPIFEMSTPPTAGLLMSGIPAVAHNSFSHEMQPEMYLDSFGPLGPPFNVPHVSPSFWPLYPPSALSTPELSLSPRSSTRSVSPSSSEECFPSASLVIPQLSIAGPSERECTTPDYLNGGLLENHIPIIPAEQGFSTIALMTSGNSSISRSPSPPPANSSPASHSSLRTPSHQSARSRKARSSTAKATRSHPSHSFSAQSSKVPCTVRGCSRKFFDKRTRDRHVASIHERAPGTGHLCPGMCREGGFSREDALNRHLLSREESSVCKIEARRLGWSPYIKSSVQLLRNFTPRD